LKGLPDSVNAVFPQAIVQACVIHLIRATLRYAYRKYWDQLATDLRRIYTAPSVEAAWAAFEELEEKWGTPYPAIGEDVESGVGEQHPADLDVVEPVSESICLVGVVGATVESC